MHLLIYHFMNMFFPLKIHFPPLYRQFETITAANSHTMSFDRISTIVSRLFYSLKMRILMHNYFEMASEETNFKCKYPEGSLTYSFAIIEKWHEMYFENCEEKLQWKLGYLLQCEEASERIDKTSKNTEKVNCIRNYSSASRWLNANGVNKRWQIMFFRKRTHCRHSVEVVRLSWI